MERNKYTTGEAVQPPASYVGRPAQAYGPTGEIHAGIVVAARYDEAGEELYADVAIVSAAPPPDGRLVAEGRLFIQVGLALTADTAPKPHTFSFTR